MFFFIMITKKKVFISTQTISDIMYTNTETSVIGRYLPKMSVRLY